MSVSKADRLKHSRELVLVARAQQRTNLGEWPIRMRGYHRALKRQEEWAIKLSKFRPSAFIMAWIYRPIPLNNYVYSKNPYLSDFPKGYTGESITPAPYVYKRKNEPN